MTAEPQRARPRVQPSPKPVLAGAVAGAVTIALALASAALRLDEGKRNVDYLDIAKVPTACYGHTGPDVRIGRRRADAECDALLTADAREHMDGVLRCTPGLATRAPQLAAATRITFNIGVKGYCGSTMARRFNAGDWRGGCDAFLAWNRAGGRVVPGLVARRERERVMCLTGLAA